MPPRRATKKATPKSSATTPAPPPLRRRASQVQNAQSSSPPIVEATPVDADAVFRTKQGGKGNLVFEPDSKVGDAGESDSDIQEIPAPRKKKVLVKAEKIGGRRRSPPRPRPVKRKVEVALPPNVVRKDRPVDSDAEVINQNASSAEPDEGYESESPEDNDDGEPEAVEDAPKRRSVNYKAWEASEDEVDDDGNLCDFIDDEAEEEEEEGGEEAMDVDGVDEDENDADAESSPLPAKISDARQLKSKKRQQNDLSDAEDAPRIRKRRAGIEKETVPEKKSALKKSAVPKKQPAPEKKPVLEKKSIRARGHDSVVDLPVRAKRDLSNKPVVIKIADDPDIEMQEAGCVSYEERPTKKDRGDGNRVRGAKDVDEGEAEPEAGSGARDEDSEQGEGEQQDEGGEQDVGDNQGEDDEEEDTADAPESVSPEKAGCEVTHPDKQTGPLLGTYAGVPPLKHSKLAPTNELVYATMTILFEGEQFPKDMNLDRIRKTVSTITVPTAFLSNPARDHPARLTPRAYNNGHMLAIDRSPSGEFADLIFFGYVTRSELVEGRTYSTQQGLKRVLKELEMVFVAQEGERVLAFISAAFGGKIAGVQVTEDGGITFSTKHTTVDEDGNVSEKKKLNTKFLAKPAGKSLPSNVVHADIHRRPREGTDTIPVFNCTAHFRGDPKKLRKQRFVPEEILTQRVRPDPSWNSEVPQGSFVCVHGTVSLYTNRTAKTKVVSFNLTAVQILALPKLG